MAENLTPVQLEVGGFEVREVMLVDYKFNQEVDREGQHHRRFHHEGSQRQRMLLRALHREVGRWRRPLRRD